MNVSRYIRILLIPVIAAVLLGSCGEDSPEQSSAPKPKPVVSQGDEVGFFNDDWNQTDSRFTLPIILKATEVHGTYSSKADAIKAATDTRKAVAIAKDWQTDGYTVFGLSEDLSKDDFAAVLSSGHMRFLVIDEYVEQIVLNNVHFTDAKSLSDAKDMINQSVEFAPDYTFVVIEHSGQFEIVRLDRDVPKDVASAQAEFDFGGNVVAQVSGKNV